MIDPLESEVVPSRKWKWFKKSEKRETNLRSRASSLGNSTHIEDDRLRVEDAHKESQDPASVKFVLNDSKGTCESLLDDLLSGVISQDSGCNESKLSFTEVKIKESRPSPVSPNTKTLPFGESGCQGCGTEQVHECEEEDLNGKEEKVEKKTGGAAMEGFIRKLEEMDIQGEVESSPLVDRNLASDAQGKLLSENILFASDIIKEVINRVTDNGLSSTEGENECPLKKHWLISKEDRVKKYLDFVQLWLEVKSGGEGQKRREANLVWKEKIEEGQSLSEVNYLEQVAILRALRRQQQFGDNEVEFDGGVEFVCFGAEQSVQVAGSFNNWQPEALEQQEDGEWVATLQLGPGTHLYKYVVDGEWLVDPSKETVSDVKGHTNNVVVVEDKVSKWQKQIQGEREEFLKTLEAGWSPSGLGLKLCPTSLTLSP